MARVEILMLDDPPEFTVDNTQVEVNASAFPVPVTFHGYFANGQGYTYFVPMDHVKLLTLMVRLPYCFHVSTGVPNFTFSWEEPTGPSEQSVVEFGGSGWMNIPLSGMEFNVGEIKAQWNGITPVPGATKARIGLKAYSINVSMIGVPDSLDATEQEIQLALKVLHTEDMVV